MAVLQVKTLDAGPLPVPYTVALVHQKGGVGKTTSAAALAASLAEQGHSTLLIDLDPSANLTAGVGLAPEMVKINVGDILTNGNTLDQAIRTTQFPNLDILPSNPGMVYLPQKLYIRAGYETLLHNLILQPRLSRYEVVMVDCPPMLDAMSIMAISAANLAIIPTQCEYFSLQALESVFRLIRMVRARSNPGLRYRLMITMYDRRGNFHRKILEQLNHQYHNILFNTTIGFDTKVRESQLLGVPVTLFDTKTRSAEQFRSLSQELLAYVKSQVLQPA